MENGIGIIEGFIRQKSITSLFRSGRKSEEETSDDFSKPIPQLSPIANSVVSRCSKILQIPTEELQHCFETQLPEHAQHVSTYARNLLEFCSYQALNVLTQRPDYLSDKEFSLLTYDMMLAWEDPGVKSEPEPLHKGDESCNVQENENEDGWSFFYSNSTNMAVQVDDKKTVGPEAFARIAPACAAVADIITVHNLFEALTSSSGGQLHFFIYNKYLGSLDKMIKNAKSASGLPLASSLTLAEGEVILDVDGSVPTQPVLQHTGISAWPGRLTLTNYALYFESLGVGLYEKAVRYDLATDLKQIVKPELTGPLGARLFDKALMYKSTAIPEPVYLEFPEFKGSSRRDYWLEISLEILYAHKFIRKYKLKHTQQAEALAKAILGIYRYHAVRDAFHICPSHYKTLLAYNLAEKLPGGDTILETLSRHLEILNSGMSQDDAIESSSVDMNRQPSLSLVSFITLTRLGFMLPKLLDVEVEAKFLERDIWVGKINPLELAVKQLKCSTGRAEAAQETVNQVKVEGIDTNIAVMKELLFPVVELFQRLQFLASWDDPFKSAMFLVVICYTIFRGWIRYIFPCIFVSIAAFMIWHKFCNKGKPLEAFTVTAPPTRNAVEQLLSLQEAISQFETLVQAGNIILLKLRALLFGVLPQVFISTYLKNLKEIFFLVKLPLGGYAKKKATDKAVVFFIIMAAVFAFVPLWFLIMIVFLEAFTREMPLRKDLSDRWLRRVREWWIGIPAAPVQLIKLEDKKRK